MSGKISDIAFRIDHTLLKAEATDDQIEQVVAEAREHKFASVCVNGIYAKRVADLLKGSGIATCAVAGFPLGAMKPTVKAIEATSVAKDGADEVDFVAHLPYLLREDLEQSRAEFRELVSAVRAVRSDIIVKVILETGALMQGVSHDQAESRIAVACKAARQAGCDFVKTSTGFHPSGGATVEAVRLLATYAGEMKVKASGGIRTAQDALTMIEAGASRLGCSSSVAIVQGEEKTADAGY